MKRAEISFHSFADHCVISHLHHAKKLVPFKKFSSTVDKTSALDDTQCGIRALKRKKSPGRKGTATPNVGKQK
jgi:hypothetical protein